MKRAFFALALTLFAFGCTTTTATGAGGDTGASTPSQRLETTPRHNEWVQVRHGDRVVQTYVAYPERATKAPAVILIHENRGLTDFERGVADRLAENGYIAVAPDMLSGMAPNGGRASDFPTQDAAREAIGKLPPEQVMADLRAVAEYAKRIPAATGKISVAGFCWGGARTWMVANDRQDLSAAFPFYGTGPQTADAVANITAPVYGFYGGDDARVNATIPKAEELMRDAGKRFEPKIYDGAGHAYMRSGQMPNATEANRRAHDESWTRWLELLRTTTGGP